MSCVRVRSRVRLHRVRLREAIVKFVGTPDRLASHEHGLRAYRLICLFPARTRGPYALTATPSAPTHNERIAAAIAHAGTCVAWFLAPLLVYVIEKDRSRYVSHQALQALLWSAFGTVVSAATCGLAIPLFLAFHIYAAIRAMDGAAYEYPLVGDLARKISGSPS